MVSDELISLINLKEVSADAGLEEGWQRDTGIPEEVTERVKGIIRRVAEEGDSALFSLTEEIEGRALTRESVRVSIDEIDASAGKLSEEMKDTVKEAVQRIERYHSEQGVKSFRINTDEARLSQILRPIERAGIYIPGGHTVYPSSVLMNVIPAMIAGVSSIAAVTPFKGELDPGIAFALKELGVSEFYRVGGAQAIAALAYGTESIKGVDKIVGPGGAYVAEAKRLVYGRVDIDSIAGPSEVAVIADTTANPLYIALDMLSQAEHGSGSETSVLVTESLRVAERVKAELINEIEKSRVREVFERLKPGALKLIVTRSRKETIEKVNEIAPEHLEIMTKSPEKDLQGIKNAGAVFLGDYTPVALGDYFIGTNHVLPTNRAARYASPLGVDDFQKRISVACADYRGLKRAAPHVQRFAEAESFIHHSLSVSRRLKG